MSNVNVPRSYKPTRLEANIPDAPAQQRNGTPRRPDDKGEHALSLMDRVTSEATFEIDRLIDDLTKLRRKVEDDGNRVQRDVAEHSSFSQSVIQLTKIVSDGMTQVKGGSGPPSMSQIGNRLDRDPTNSETQIPTFLTAIEQE